MQEQGQRVRAGQALGELADPRALDDLLKLASDETNALQAVASEAIGHLGATEKAGDIFRLLERYSRGGPMCAAALKGLRWLGTHDAWRLIRERAADLYFNARPVAVELVGYNDHQSTRHLLTRLLAEEQNFHPVVNNALQAARRLWGEESLEPDYALLQNHKVNAHQVRASLDRVCAKGSGDRILE